MDADGVRQNTIKIKIMKKLKISKKDLIKAYNIDRLKLQEICIRFACGETTVVRLLKRYKIFKRGMVSSIGNKKYTSKGYILILLPFHPFSSKRGYVREHRLMMEKYLGRYLKREEVVHHENDIRDDNRIENLRLFSNQGKHNKFHRNRVNKEKGSF